MQRALRNPHGHSMETLTSLLEDSWTGLEGRINASTKLLSGWSDINIQVERDGIHYLVKLPGLTKVYDQHPFAKQFHIMSGLHPLGICPEPDCIGRLADKNQTPFLIRKFVEGTIYDKLTDFTQDDFSLLRERLELFSKQRPSEVPSFNNPRDYLDSLHVPVQNQMDALHRPSPELGQLAEEFDEIVTRLRPIFERPPIWDMTLTHGDLHEENIVFQNDQVVFLDFEACFFGASIFDTAYLQTESYDGCTMNPMPGLVDAHSTLAVQFFRPLALASTIGWCVRKLAEFELGIIEENLIWPSFQKDVTDYLHDKTTHLSALLDDSNSS